MKSSTYGSIATIVFIKNKEKVCKSLDSAIKVTDNYCKKLSLNNELSYMTKYRIINELVKSNVLIDDKNKKNRKISLSNKINDIIKWAYQ